MSASHAPALDAIALQLVEALDRYERDVDRMVETWLDMELYAAVSQEIEEIRKYCAALTHVSVAWVELLIAHTELVHGLWRTEFRDSQGTPLADLRAAHAGCVRTLRRRCLHELKRNGKQAGAGPSATVADRNGHAP